MKDITRGLQERYNPSIAGKNKNGKWGLKSTFGKYGWMKGKKMWDNGGGIKKRKVKDQEVERKKERKVEN